MAKPPRVLDFKKGIPAPLARRIAEAADGHRGGDHWVVFSTVEEDPKEQGRKKKHYVRGFNDRTEAETEAALYDHRQAIGPFVTEKWATRRDREITKIEVTSKKRQGGPYKDNLNLQEADALFWSESVIDKVLIPYYVQIHGWEYGAEITEAFNDPEVYALTHLPGSEYAGKVSEDPGGTGKMLVTPIIPGDAARKAALLSGTAGPSSDTPEGAGDAPSPAVAPEPPRNDSQA
jgi:hypothetical protein